MKTDLVLSPFDAHMDDVLEATRTADEAGFDGVWIFDHFSAASFGRSWSHHPFTALGAMAVVTSRVRLGCLVANMVNRHPTQVASALGTLTSLAPGRVVCGLGAGAGPGSHFSGEQDMIGRRLGPSDERRAHLADYIAAVRASWTGDDVSGSYVVMDEPCGMVPPGPVPPIIVGASTTATARLAIEHGDGLNLRRTSSLFSQLSDIVELVEERQRQDGSSGFDIAMNDDIDIDHDLGGPTDTLAEHGITRRTLAVKAPYPIDRIRSIGRNLAEATP